ncbi:hypothetical protein CEE37_00565 [candidate division LCP-89 bacterium B3_LCP]|uniref:Uncharacterized protein n=1 Tax=candidate division LCP-89 bacterium B3_LCP TaxID=2012998 RepID=A0A532V4S1_UNCL8|nr:MAG: hypothetical protein CEE37_00565 [candidate division LCP-89 bacterium B3_LCP]
MHKLARYEVDKRKQKLIDYLEDEELFEEILDTFKPRELVEIQVIFWNYVIDYSYVTGENFSRHNITERMESTANYQYRVGCNERIDYCRGNICINTHPNCAGDKLKAQIITLREILLELKKSQ